MKVKNIIILLTIFSFFIPAVSGVTNKKNRNVFFDTSSKSSGRDFQYKLLSPYARIFTDRFPYSESCYLPVAVPRNYMLGFQLALKSQTNQWIKVTLANVKGANGNIFKGKFTLKRLLPVHIEGNTQGSMINRPGGKTPASWKPYFIRIAPFDVLEAVDDLCDNVIAVKAEHIAGALLQIYIPANCPPGLYKGEFILQESAGNKKTIPVSFVVHKTVVPKVYFLNSTHWLSELPENLKSGVPVKWWSEAHWKLLARAGKLLLENGDNVMYTPLINSKHPIIRTILDKHGKIHFDFTNFDRWLRMFDKLGFKYFAGQQLISQKENLYIRLAETGKLVQFSDSIVNMPWFDFLEVFLKNLNIHLNSNGMKSRYYQSLYDEPRDPDIYKQYNDILKRNMPGIKSIDAINFRPELFSDHIDIQVFNLPGIVREKNKTVRQRLREDKGVWLYNCSSPYPPYPNRHLDLPLTENRIWPWLCYKFGATGYLWWAANLYRGIPDEYKTSLGPFPNGSQDPGHPPGDDWFYYRTSKGLIPSLRIISFREGMIDVTLLKMLEKIDSIKVQELISELVHPEIEQGHDRRWQDYLTTADTIPKGYETSPKIFYEVREKLLVLLDDLDLKPHAYE